MYEKDMQAYNTLRSSTYWIGDSIQVSGSRNIIKIRGGKEVKLQPRLISVLTLLASTPKDVISRPVLIDTVWREYYTGDLALNQAISKLRRALGDSPDNPTIIETVVKSGYRLLLPVYHHDPQGRSVFSKFSNKMQHLGWIVSAIGIIAYLVFASAKGPQPVIVTQDPGGMLSEELQAKIEQLSENPEMYDEVMTELQKAFPDSSFQVVRNDSQSLMIYNK